MEAAASVLGIQPVILEIQRAEDIVPAFETLKERADALYVVIDSLVVTHATRINTLALGAKLPTMYGGGDVVRAGGLMSYGANIPDLWRRGADYVDKILRGAKPADLPVEQPTKFDLAINITTIKALGITVPPTLLARADEVIMPTMAHAGVYSAVLHYLRAIRMAGTEEGKAVATKMRELRVDDFFAKGGEVRADGRLVHAMYLVEVKAPEKSRQPWDYYKILSVIPGNQAFRPLVDGKCPFVPALSRPG